MMRIGGSPHLAYLLSLAEPAVNGVLVIQAELSSEVPMKLAALSLMLC